MVETGAVWLRPGTVRLPPWPGRLPFTAGDGPPQHRPLPHPAAVDHYHLDLDANAFDLHFALNVRRWHGAEVLRRKRR
ncbi:MULTISPECIES: hypothetical protein [unclassified Streptomyces]|uniref:hypothetical protein n=1 Tax=unclassified Streptomyces TaxID=2593676 RepID=UPI002258E4BE|nr:MULTISPECIES: hypothetical protein [unclassified Streptomyces]MCX4992795.1 DUF3556 domain-containing protein [Streptomyces sp. NBC_00568]MCX5001968.1 DUF3556 domain-containing protein [Streptomyces sp. NBC_00638]